MELTKCQSRIIIFLMNKKQKEGQYKLFAEAFHEVVVPELAELKDDMKDVKDRVGRIETKLDKIDDRLDRRGVALDNHEKRIGKLETHTGIAS